MYLGDSASRDKQSLQSGIWRCGAMAAFFILMAQGRASSPPELSVRKPRPWASQGLAEEAARAFERSSGYATSTIAPTTSADESAAVARLLTIGGSSAAVILMDTDVLGRVLPRCDWKTPLLRMRNHFADEGVKAFAALALPHRSGIVSAARARYISGRVERFCNHEGVGFLGTVNLAPTSATSMRPNIFNERAGVALGSRLASAAFFCCDAFRIKAPHSLS